MASAQKMSLGYWGSKKKLASDIADELGTGSDYYEPFCGMAYVGMELLRRESFARSTWSDANADVVLYWQALQDGWLPTARPVTQEQWERYRTPGARSTPQRSFHGVHLGFGGQFLAGRAPNARLNTEAHLRATRARIRDAGELLSDAPLRVERRSFESMRPARGATVYCDPPYVRVGGNPDLNWTPEEMEALWESVRGWLARDCAVYLSASERPRVPRDLRATTVRRWQLLNRIATHVEGAKRYREELLLRLTLR